MAKNPDAGFILMNKHKILILLLVIVLACDSTLEESGVPNVAVNIEINLSDVDNIALTQIGGYIYVVGGVRGIIVRHESQNLYRAFDRNCTFNPSVSTAIVDVHTSGFYLEDTSCNSTFDVNGFPTGGQADFPLKEYNITQAGDILFIVN
jgi:hypothetical protein